MIRTSGVHDVLRLQMTDDGSKNIIYIIYAELAETKLYYLLNIVLCVISKQYRDNDENDIVI